MGRAKPADRIELLQGTLDLLVLRTLQLGPLHGHGIVKAIQRHSDDLLLVAWVMGWTVFHVAGGLIHLLLVIALISLVLHFVRGGRAAV